MEERTTKTIKTPLDKELILKEYLTARERRDLRMIYLKGMNTEIAAGNQPVTKLTGNVVDEAENKLIELAVISYDGSKEAILERLLDGVSEEFDFVIKAVDKVANFTMAK